MDSRKLAEAAEALVQAAVAETEANSLALSREIASSVKLLADGSFKASVDGKLNTTNQHLADLKDAVALVKASVDLQTDAIKSLTKTFQEQTRLQNITDAIKNDNYLALIRFVYRGNNDSYTSNHSDTLVKAILRAFRKNQGYYITGLYIGETYSNNKDVAGFQKKLCDQIEDLLGKRPRITEADGKTTIWRE